MAKAEPAKAETAKPAKAEPKILYVLDTTANAAEPKRTHAQIVDGAERAFTFEHGKALPLPEPIAVKFLRHEAFKLTDAEGNPVVFKRRPKQPDELQAGEEIKLGEDETIARYDELSNGALQQRAMEMPGGEKFAGTPAKAAMIAFIIAHKKTLAEANTSKVKDIGKDDFVPEAELDDEAA